MGATTSKRNNLKIEQSREKIERNLSYYVSPNAGHFFSAIFAFMDGVNLGNRYGDWYNNYYKPKESRDIYVLKAFDVPKGNLYKQLKNGETIEIILANFNRSDPMYNGESWHRKVNPWTDQSRFEIPDSWLAHIFQSRFFELNEYHKSRVDIFYDTHLSKHYSKSSAYGFTPFERRTVVQHYSRPRGGYDSYSFHACEQPYVQLVANTNGLDFDVDLPGPLTHVFRTLLFFAHSKEEVPNPAILYNSMSFHGYKSQFSVYGNFYQNLTEFAPPAAATINFLPRFTGQIPKSPKWGIADDTNTLYFSYNRRSHSLLDDRTLKWTKDNDKLRGIRTVYDFVDFSNCVMHSSNISAMTNIKYAHINISNSLMYLPTEEKCVSLSKTLKDRLEVQVADANSECFFETHREENIQELVKHDIIDNFFQDFNYSINKKFDEYNITNINTISFLDLRTICMVDVTYNQYTVFSYPYIILDFSGDSIAMDESTITQKLEYRSVEEKNINIKLNFLYGPGCVIDLDLYNHLNGSDGLKFLDGKNIVANFAISGAKDTRIDKLDALEEEDGKYTGNIENWFRSYNCTGVANKDGDKTFKIQHFFDGTDTDNQAEQKNLISKGVDDAFGRTNFAYHKDDLANEADECILNQILFKIGGSSFKYIKNVTFKNSVVEFKNNLQDNLLIWNCKFLNTDLYTCDTKTRDFNNCTFSKGSFNNLNGTFTNCTFKNFSFSVNELSLLQLKGESIFENCVLSGPSETEDPSNVKKLIFEEVAGYWDNDGGAVPAKTFQFKNCSFNNCRLIGCSINDISMEQCEIINCSISGNVSTDSEATKNTTKVDLYDLIKENKQTQITNSVIGPCSKCHIKYTHIQDTTFKGKIDDCDFSFTSFENINTEAVKFTNSISSIVDISTDTKRYVRKKNMNVVTSKSIYGIPGYRPQCVINLNQEVNEQNVPLWINEEDDIIAKDTNPSTTDITYVPKTKGIVQNVTILAQEVNEQNVPLWINKITKDIIASDTNPSTSLFEAKSTTNQETTISENIVTVIPKNLVRNNVQVYTHVSSSGNRTFASSRDPRSIKGPLPEKFYIDALLKFRPENSNITELPETEPLRSYYLNLVDVVKEYDQDIRFRYRSLTTKNNVKVLCNKYDETDIIATDIFDFFPLRRYAATLGTYFFNVDYVELFKNFRHIIKYQILESGILVDRQIIINGFTDENKEYKVNIDAFYWQVSPTFNYKLISRWINNNDNNNDIIYSPTDPSTNIITYTQQGSILVGANINQSYKKFKNISSDDELSFENNLLIDTIFKDCYNIDVSNAMFYNTKMLNNTFSNTALPNIDNQFVGPSWNLSDYKFSIDFTGSTFKQVIAYSLNNTRLTDTIWEQVNIDEITLNEATIKNITMYSISITVNPLALSLPVDYYILNSSTFYVLVGPGIQIQIPDNTNIEDTNFNTVSLGNINDGYFKGIKFSKCNLEHITSCVFINCIFNNDTKFTGDIIDSLFDNCAFNNVSFGNNTTINSYDSVKFRATHNSLSFLTASFCNLLITNSYLSYGKFSQTLSNVKFNNSQLQSTSWITLNNINNINWRKTLSVAIVNSQLQNSEFSTEWLLLSNLYDFSGSNLTNCNLNINKKEDTLKKVYIPKLATQNSANGELYSGYVRVYEYRNVTQNEWDDRTKNIIKGSNEWTAGKKYWVQKSSDRAEVGSKPGPSLYLPAEENGELIDYTCVYEYRTVTEAEWNDTTKNIIKGSDEWTDDKKYWVHKGGEFFDEADLLATADQDVPVWVKTNNIFGHHEIVSSLFTTKWTSKHGAEYNRKQALDDNNLPIWVNKADENDVKSSEIKPDEFEKYIPMQKVNQAGTLMWISEVVSETDPSTTIITYVAKQAVSILNVPIWVSEIASETDPSTNIAYTRSQLVDEDGTPIWVSEIASYNNPDDTLYVAKQAVDENGIPKWTTEIASDNNPDDTLYVAKQAVDENGIPKWTTESTTNIISSANNPNFLYQLVDKFGNNLGNQQIVIILDSTSILPSGRTFKINYKNQSLKNLSLTNMDFSEGDFTGATFTNINFQGSVFGTEQSQVILTDPTNESTTSTQFINCNFTNCDFTNMDFSKFSTELRPISGVVMADFFACMAKNITINNTELPKNCFVIESKSIGSTIPGTHMFGPNIFVENFGYHSTSRLQHSFENTVLVSCLFGENNKEACNLQDANFSSAVINNCTFLNSEANNATFENSDLSNSLFTDSRLNNANFKSANLVSTIFRDTEMKEVNLVGVTISADTHFITLNSSFSPKLSIMKWENNPKFMSSTIPMEFSDTYVPVFYNSFSLIMIKAPTRVDTEDTIDNLKEQAKNLATQEYSIMNKEQLIFAIEHMINASINTEDTIDNLKEQAKNLAIKEYSTMNKEELIAIIEHMKCSQITYSNFEATLARESSMGKLIYKNSEYYVPLHGTNNKIQTDSCGIPIWIKTTQENACGYFEPKWSVNPNNLFLWVDEHNNIVESKEDPSFKYWVRTQEVNEDGISLWVNSEDAADIIASEVDPSQTSYVRKQEQEVNADGNLLWVSVSNPSKIISGKLETIYLVNTNDDLSNVKVMSINGEYQVSQTKIKYISADIFNLKVTSNDSDEITTNHNIKIKIKKLHNNDVNKPKFELNGQNFILSCVDDKNSIIYVKPKPPSNPETLKLTITENNFNITTSLNVIDRSYKNYEINFKRGPGAHQLKAEILYDNNETKTIDWPVEESRWIDVEDNFIFMNTTVTKGNYIIGNDKLPYYFLSSTTNIETPLKISFTKGGSALTVGELTGDDGAIDNIAGASWAPNIVTSETDPSTTGITYVAKQAVHDDGKPIWVKEIASHYNPSTTNITYVAKQAVSIQKLPLWVASFDPHWIEESNTNPDDTVFIAKQAVDDDGIPIWVTESASDDKPDDTLYVAKQAVDDDGIPLWVNKVNNTDIVESEENPSNKTYVPLAYTEFSVTNIIPFNAISINVQITDEDKQTVNNNWKSSISFTSRLAEMNTSKEIDRLTTPIVPPGYQLITWNQFEKNSPDITAALLVLEEGDNNFDTSLSPRNIFKNFQNINLSNCNLTGTYNDVTFNNAVLININFNDCDFSPSSPLTLEQRQQNGLGRAGASFSGVTLNNVTFTNCNLQECMFSNVTIDNLTFINCNLQKAYFEPVGYLNNVNFENSDLIECKFRNAIFRNCLINSSFNNVIFSGNFCFMYCQFKIKHFNNIIVDGNKSFLELFEESKNKLPIQSLSDINLIKNRELDSIQYEDLSNKTFIKVSFANQTLKNIDFSGCTFKDVDFTNTELDTCNFTSINLISWTISGTTSFFNCELNNIDFRNNKQTLGELNEDGSYNIGSGLNTYGEPIKIDAETGYPSEHINVIDYWGIVFHTCRMKNVDFSSCGLRSACFYNCDLTESNFSRSFITGFAKFQQCNLTNANFIRANFENSTTFENVDLNNTTFSDPAYSIYDSFFDRELSSFDLTNINIKNNTIEDISGALSVGNNKVSNNVYVIRRQ